ncbi:DUF2285 domain-containing protein [Aromatoleum toluclasticum]|uniref:transcriptional regulator domain-containing protein n=1 Tax=Aromatoleum toluclasticum TaxID=92003 RepID=UPI001D193F26|nr:DUF2285 domain-containing protein [Aromatoleum toluclasticum]MCC4114658.1 DUF2285 domain-containing protein [Aromatoleum toluclasticum]
MSESIFPNWRDAVAYPSSFDDWPLMKWVWEFLRRNAEYQEDFARYASFPEYTDDGKTGKLQGTAIRIWEPMCYRYSDPPALLGETGEQYLSRMEAAGLEFTELPLGEYLTGKWGIDSLLNPANPDDWCFDDGTGNAISLTSPRLGGRQVPSEVELLHGFEGADEWYERSIRFDLRKPIDRQIEEAQRILLFEREEIRRERDFPTVSAPKIHKRKLPEYLRAFDAASVSATVAEIAEWMYPKLPRQLPRDAGITRAEHAVRQGRWYVQRGYFELMLWG